MKKVSKVQWGYIVCPFPFANLVISLNKLGWRERKMKERFIERNETERKTEIRISTSAIVLGHPLPLNELTPQRDSESEVLCNSHSMSILLH